METPSKQQRVRTEPFESQTNLEVFLRIRPKDESKSATTRYQITNEHQSIRNQRTSLVSSSKHIVPHSKHFVTKSTKNQVFHKIGANAIHRFLNGYTNLIFTYGITGSGKTHTISGQNLDGLLPKILQGIFNHDEIKHNKDNRFSIYASYLENYTNSVLDLLCNDQQHHIDKGDWNPPQQHSKSNKVTVRVLNRERVHLGNLSTVQISSSEQALRCIQNGNLKRSSAHTKLNTDSSRSHAVFILDLFANEVCKSRLCIVDLAGSESVKKAGFDVNDPRFQESKEINKSLSVLGRCLESIQNKHSSNLQAPWRESLLTKILWEYLHGKSYVTMIVAAHIVDDEYNETMRALEFAANSQCIKMNPVVNSLRPSTRHKSRVHQKRNAPDTPQDDSLSSNVFSSSSLAPTINLLSAQDMRFINTCTMGELRRIALESHKAASRCMESLVSMKRRKQKLIKGVLKAEEERKKWKRNVIHQVIPEQIVSRQDQDQHQRTLNELRNGYEQQLNEYSLKLNEEKHKFDELCKQMIQSECQREEELARVKGIEDANLLLQAELTEIKQKHNELMQQTEETKKSLNLKLNGLEVELAMKSAKCHEFEAKLQQYEKECEEMEIRLQSEKQALSQKLVKYKQGIETKGHKDNAVQFTPNQEIEISAKLSELQAENNEHRQQIQQLEKEKEELLKKQQYSEKEIQENETESLQKLNTFQETLNSYQQRTQQLQQRYAIQYTQLSGCYEEIEELKKIRNELKNSLQTLRTESQQNQQSLVSVIQQRMILRSAKIDKVQQNLTETVQKLSAMETDYQRYKERSAELLQSKDKQIERLKTNYIEIRQIDKAMNSDRQTENNETHELLEKKQEADTERLQQEMTAKAKRHRLKLNDTDQEYQCAVEESKETYQENQIETKTISQQCESVSSHHQKEIVELKQQIHALEENEIKIRQQHADELITIQKKMQFKIESEKSENQCLFQQIESLQGQIQTLQIQCSSLSAAASKQSMNTVNDDDEMKDVQIKTSSNKSSGKKRKRSRQQMESNSDGRQHSEEHTNPDKKQKISMDNALPSFGILDCEQQQGTLSPRHDKQQTYKNGRNAKLREMRMPASKETKRRITAVDLVQPTPRTKEGLYKLRVVDLKKKLKKRSLKPGKKKKAGLINLLHSHFEKEKHKQQQEEEEEEAPEKEHGDHNHSPVTGEEKMKNERSDENDDNVQESSDVIQSEMIGRCIGEENGNKYYRGIIIDGTLYNVGDEVYICNNYANEMWLGYIVSLFENEDGDRYMGNSWFWSYSEIKKAVKKTPHSGWKPSANEVFLSKNHKIDINHISLANTKQRFKVFGTKREMNEDKTNVPAYFCEYEFDLKTKALIERPRYQPHPCRKSKRKIEPIDESDEEEDQSENGEQDEHVHEPRRRRNETDWFITSTTAQRDTGTNHNLKKSRAWRNRQRKKE